MGLGTVRCKKHPSPSVICGCHMEPGRPKGPPPSGGSSVYDPQEYSKRNIPLSNKGAQVSKYIIAKVESFFESDTKWEITDPDYLGQGPKVIAEFVDEADARNFIVCKDHLQRKFLAGAAKFAEKNPELMNKLAELDAPQLAQAFLNSLPHEK